MSPAHGLLLAAGEGRRMGGPKALVREPDGSSWLVRSVAVLRDGGCDAVTVVLGASADEARRLIPNEDAVVCPDWADGLGSSLACGLRHLGDVSAAQSALVHLVDLPDVGAEVVRRLLDGASGPSALRRASYDGLIGHPVLLGRGHWSELAASARGDEGARGYLAEHDVELVECGDLATGQDVDHRQ